MKRSLLSVAALTALLAWAVSRADDQGVQGPPKSGVFADPNYFPLAVWLQDPRNAGKYRDAGINTYVALYRGPTAEQLAELKKHGMKVVCEQNRGLTFQDDPTIIAWMHGDEPDNAQALPQGQRGYGPPIPPEKIVEGYRKIKMADPTRPVMLNLGQGVAWDGWHGRGVRTNHPEDYPEYIQGSDIVSFDIYPACHDNKQVAGKLWMVADGVSRLRKWSNDRKTVWNCIETTHIENPNPSAKATPQQVKAEVWMSIVRGSRGIIYFCHEFKPKFVEAGLLADPDMLAGVTATNRQIQELAPVLNGPSVADAISIESSSADVPVEATVRTHDGATYVFAVGMRDGQTTAKFKVAGVRNGKAEVLGENRTVEVQNGSFSDSFKPWDVHLYRVGK